MGIDRIQAVFFDIDDTLFDRERAQQEILRVISRQMSYLFQGIEEEKIVDAFLESDRNLPPLSDVTLRDQRSRTFLRLLGLDEEFAYEITKAYVEQYPDLNTPIVGAREVVSELAKRYRLGVISNSLPDVQYRKLATMEIRHLLDCIVLAGEVGIEKPDPEIFLHAASLLGVAPENSLYVGDSHANDVVGAKRAGMLTCWFNPSQKPLPSGGVRPDFEVRSLGEILGILNFQ